MSFSDSSVQKDLGLYMLRNETGNFIAKKSDSKIHWLFLKASVYD